MPDTMLPEYYGLMNPRESARNARYSHPALRHTDVITRALQRSVLSHYTGLPPSQWTFATTDGGKPYISSPTSNLHFNLSHTAEWIVCAVADFPCVGIDIEQCRRKVETMRMAERFFSLEEFKALQRLPTSTRKNRFFDYWTLKEAYIKARGEGISLGLDKFSFSFSDDRQIGFSCDPQLADNPGAWHFRLSTGDTDHRLALAVKPSIPTYTLRMRQFSIIPLHSIEDYTGPLLLSN